MKFMRFTSYVYRTAALGLCFSLILPNGYSAISGADFSPAPVNSSAKLEDLFRQSPLPESLGRVDRHFFGTKPGFVVVIQNAHGIPDAQNSIFKIIRFLKQNYGIEDALFEGVSGELDPLIFKSFPEPRLLKDIFKDYNGKGELSAGALSSILDSMPGRSLGLEKWALYEEGIRLFLAAAQASPQIEAKIRQLKEDIDLRKEQIYSPEMRRIDQLFEAFYKDNSKIIELLKELSLRRRPPEQSILSDLIQEAEEKSSGDYESEMKNLILQLEIDLKSNPYEWSSAEVKRFNRETQSWKTGQSSLQVLGLTVKEVISKHRLPLKISKGLAHKINRQERFDTITGTFVFSELEAYMESVAAEFMESQEARDLFREEQDVRILERLVKLELDQESWERVQTLLRGVENQGVRDVLKDAGTAIDFYQNAKQRDTVFFDKASTHLTRSSSRSAAVVAGGFHSAGLTEHLEKEGISYLLLMPSIETMPEKSNYREQMQGQTSWSQRVEVESDGRVSVYKAFVRETRDRLLRQIKVPEGIILKKWRDQILKDLSRQNRLASASDYTRFIDETLEDQELQRVQGTVLLEGKRFAASVKKLEMEGQLNVSAVMRLFPSMTVESFWAGPAQISPEDYLSGSYLPSGVESPRTDAAPFEIAGREVQSGTKRSEVRSLNEFLDADGTISIDRLDLNEGLTTAALSKGSEKTELIFNETSQEGDLPENHLSAKVPVRNSAKTVLLGTLDDTLVALKVASTRETANEFARGVLLQRELQRRLAEDPANEALEKALAYFPELLGTYYEKTESDLKYAVLRRNPKGISLSQAIEEKSFKERLEIFEALTEMVDVFAQAGIAVVDLKPDNVLAVNEGGKTRLFFIDPDASRFLVKSDLEAAVEAIASTDPETERALKGTPELEPSSGGTPQFSAPFNNKSGFRTGQKTRPEELRYLSLHELSKTAIVFLFKDATHGNGFGKATLRGKNISSFLDLLDGFVQQGESSPEIKASIEDFLKNIRESIELIKGLDTFRFDSIDEQYTKLRSALEKIQTEYGRLAANTASVFEQVENQQPVYRDNPNSLESIFSNNTVTDVSLGLYGETYGILKVALEDEQGRRSQVTLVPGQDKVKEKGEYAVRGNQEVKDGEVFLIETLDGRIIAIKQGTGKEGAADKKVQLGAQIQQVLSDRLSQDSENASLKQAVSFFPDLLRVGTSIDDQENTRTTAVRTNPKGQTLRDAIRQNYADQEPLSFEERLTVYKQIVRDVQNLYEQGVALQDIKPDNLYLVKDSDGKKKAIFIDLDDSRFLESTAASLQEEIVNTTGNAVSAIVSPRVNPDYTAKTQGLSTQQGLGYLTFFELVKTGLPFLFKDESTEVLQGDFKFRDGTSVSLGNYSGSNVGLTGSSIEFFSQIQSRIKAEDPSGRLQGLFDEFRAIAEEFKAAADIDSAETFDVLGKFEYLQTIINRLQTAYAGLIEPGTYSAALQIAFDEAEAKVTVESSLTQGTAEAAAFSSATGEVSLGFAPVSASVSSDKTGEVKLNFVPKVNADGQTSSNGRSEVRAAASSAARLFDQQSRSAAADVQEVREKLAELVASQTAVALFLDEFITALEKQAAARGDRHSQNAAQAMKDLAVLIKTLLSDKQSTVVIQPAEGEEEPHGKALQEFAAQLARVLVSGKITEPLQAELNASGVRYTAAGSLNRLSDPDQDFFPFITGTLNPAKTLIAKLLAISLTEDGYDAPAAEAYSDRAFGILLGYAVGLIAVDKVSGEEIREFNQLSSQEQLSAVEAEQLKKLTQVIQERIVNELSNFNSNAGGLLQFKGGAVSVVMSAIQKFVDEYKTTQAAAAAA